LRRALCTACLLLVSACASSATVRDGRPDGSPLERLAAGNHRFVSGRCTGVRAVVARRGEVAKAQRPFAVIVGCADSRVPPEFVFDSGLGDLFVVRVAGDVCEDAALGSIEYAVEHLGARTIVVLGHERCGAVEATLKGGEAAGHMGAFVTPIAANIWASSGATADALDGAVRANASAIARQISACGPILSHLVHEGALTVVAARYDLDTGEVEFLEGAAPGHP
jgi:carbonic anhydrase